VNTGARASGTESASKSVEALAMRMNRGIARFMG
jgi:hypothetical protein